MRRVCRGRAGVPSAGCLGRVLCRAASSRAGGSACSPGVLQGKGCPGAAQAAGALGSAAGQLFNRLLGAASSAGLLSQRPPPVPCLPNPCLLTRMLPTPAGAAAAAQAGLRAAARLGGAAGNRAAPAGRTAARAAPPRPQTSGGLHRRVPPLQLPCCHGWLAGWLAGWRERMRGSVLAGSAALGAPSTPTCCTPACASPGAPLAGRAAGSPASHWQALSGLSK